MSQTLTTHGTSSRNGRRTQQSLPALLVHLRFVNISGDDIGNHVLNCYSRYQLVCSACCGVISYCLMYRVRGTHVVNIKCHNEVLF